MRVPWVCSQRVQCSGSVASGWAAICARKAAYCSGVILGGLPERGLVATVPRLRRHCRQRVNERRLRPKLRAISAPLRPASAAWRTCSRSSTEYSGRVIAVVCHFFTHGRHRRSHQQSTARFICRVPGHKQAAMTGVLTGMTPYQVACACVTRRSSLPHLPVLKPRPVIAGD